MKLRKTARRTFAALCAAAAVFFAQVPMMSAQGADDSPKLTASVSSANAGESVSVSVSLSGNTGLWGLKFKVGYDHSALKLNSVKTGEVFSDSEITPPQSLDGEKYVFFACRNSTDGDIAANGVVATFDFSVMNGAQAKEYPIVLELAQAINNAKSEIKMTVADGVVTVNAPSAVPGGASPLTGSGLKAPLMALLMFTAAGTAAFITIRKKASSGKALERRH